MFLNPNIFSNLKSNFSNLYDMRNLQEQVKAAFCYQKLFWPFITWINCSSDLKNFANSQPSSSNFKSFSQSLEHIFFLTVGQNNFGNKIPFLQLLLLTLSDCKYPARLLTLLAYLSKSMGLDYHPFESILACVNCNSLIDLATLSYSELWATSDF